MLLSCFPGLVLLVLDLVKKLNFPRPRSFPGVDLIVLYSRPRERCMRGSGDGFMCGDLVKISF